MPFNSLDKAVHIMTYGRCTFTYCRYNVDHKCTDQRHRQECISVKHNKWYMKDEFNRKLMENVKEDE